MEIQGSIGQIRDLIAEAKKIIVFTHKSPNLDSITALLALGQMFDKLQKEYVLVCQDSIPHEFTFLKGSDKIKKTLGSRNLVIGIKNGKELVDKVSYFTQGSDFNLVITPRDKSITADQILYSFTGLEADLLITVDTIRLTGLGPIFDTFAQDFKDIPVVNIDRHSQNTRFGKVNLVDSAFSSTAELILKVSQELNVAMDKELATIVLAGLYGGSHNFLSQTTNEKSFETSLQLLQAGADLRAILDNLGPYLRGEKEQRDSSLNEEKEMTHSELDDGFEGSVPETAVQPEKLTADTEPSEVEPAIITASPDDSEYHLPTPQLHSMGDIEEETPFTDPTVS
jgi:hypothetical protein